MQDTTNVNSKLEEAVKREAQASEAIRNRLAQSRVHSKVHNVSEASLHPTTPTKVLRKKLKKGKVTNEAWKKFEEKVCSLVREKVSGLHNENRVLKNLKAEDEKHFRRSSTRYTQ